MATTVNEDFRDALLRRQIGLLRFSGSVRNEILEVLDTTEADLKAEIDRRLARLAGIRTLTPEAVARLKVLRESIKEIRASAFDKMYDLWNTRMKELAKHESDYLAVAFQTVSPVVLELALPTASQLLALVSTQPFEGKTLKQWAASVQRADLDRIMGQVQIGIVQGQTSQQIARRIVGTVSQGGADGVTQLTRADAASITRTAVNFFSNKTKEVFYQANDDIVKEELYVATLDARTTPICRSLDGKSFPLGKGPRPPLHFNCRSVRVAVFGKKALGDRPAKPVTERQLLDEFTSSNDLDLVTSRDALPHGYKGDYDLFASKRIRELTGTVPAATTYQEWLSSQSASFQDDVLGKTKGALFRRGDLTLDRFVDRQGNELTLAELARRDASAFRKAGLDPSDYL